MLKLGVEICGVKELGKELPSWARVMMVRLAMCRSVDHITVEVHVVLRELLITRRCA